MRSIMANWDEEFVWGKNEVFRGRVSEMIWWLPSKWEQISEYDVERPLWYLNDEIRKIRDEPL